MSTQFVNIRHYPIGLYLPNGLYTEDGIKLLKEGTFLTRSKREKIKNFRVDRNGIPKIGGMYEVEDLKLENINTSFYSAVKNMNMDEIFQCAQVLIDNVEYSGSIPLIEDIKLFDDVTYKHSINVAALSAYFGLKLELPKERLLTLVTGALLHDIGKLKVSKDIITKPGKLSNEEFFEIKKHPVLGREILKQIDSLTPFAILQIVYQHHENWNGTGYPLGLKEYGVFDLAMIVHICDVFDALTSKRSYKEAFSREKVWDIMQNGRGTLFSPYLFDKFKDCMPDYFVGEEIYINETTKFVVIQTDTNSFNPIVVGKNYKGRLKEIS